jgi:hypothetical protein
MHDVEMRLVGTVVRWKGAAVYIKTAFYADDGETYMLRIKHCVKWAGCPAHLDVALDDPFLDVSSPPLGYIPQAFPWGNGWAYAVRMPARRQQQGILLNKVLVYSCGVFPQKIRNMVEITELGKCIDGLYEGEDYYVSNYDQLYEKHVIPFSRDIAASSRHLFYHAHVVGDIVRKGDVFHVNITSPSFRFYQFKEVFSENWRFDWN